MPVSLALPLVALACLTHIVAISAEMSTTNSMPTNLGKQCRLSGICGQGTLLTESLLRYSGEDYTIAFVVGNDLQKSAGWPPGEVTEAQVGEIFTFVEPVCRLKLRGVTLLKILRALAGSDLLPGVSDGSGQMLQYSGLRVTYSTTLPAHDRLVKVEWWDKEAGGGSGAYVAFDRTKLYGVALLKYDREHADPYKVYWSVPSLDDEFAACETSDQMMGPLIRDFLTANSPYTIPAAESRLLSEDGGTAIVVDQDGPYCFRIGEMFDAAVYSCVPCPTDQTPSNDGLSCEGGASPPSVTLVPVTLTPETPDPVTASPLNMTNGGSTTSSGTSLGLIIGVVVAGIVLIAVAVAVVVIRLRSAPQLNNEEGLLDMPELPDGNPKAASSPEFNQNEADII